VTPEIVDPDFLYINLDVFFKYDPSSTNFTKAQLESRTRNSIRAFSDEELDKFGAVFRYSNFLNTVDRTDMAILNSFAQVYLEKRFSPTVGVSRRYELDFSTPLYVSPDSGSVIRDTSTFTISGFDRCYLIDTFDESAQQRIVSIKQGIGPNQRTIIKNAGFVEGSKIILNNFAPQEFEGLSLRVEAYPDAYDIAATFNNIIEINRTEVVGTVDSIVAGREFSGTQYTTPSRNPR
jgi:hypothetical protein